MAVPLHAYSRLDDMASQPGLMQRSLPDDKQEDLTDSLTTDTVVIDTAAMAAVTDSLLQRAMEPRKLTPFCPDPIRAMWISLVFPGGGQIYNRKYWKLPIVYGAFMGCLYAITWNNRNYQDYSDAYRDLVYDQTNKVPQEEWHQTWQNMSSRDPADLYKDSNFQTTLKNRKDYYRRYRDLSIIITVGVYALSMIDAYVDAHLFDFDISPDLSLRMEPVYAPKTRYNASSYGINCSLKF